MKTLIFFLWCLFSPVEWRIIRWDYIKVWFPEHYKRVFQELLCLSNFFRNQIWKKRAEAHYRLLAEAGVKYPYVVSI